MLNFFKKLLSKQEPVETKTVDIIPVTDSIVIEEQKPVALPPAKDKPKKPSAPRKKK